MKNHIIFILIVILGLNIYFLPKKNEPVNEKIEIPDQINITLTGEVVFEGTYTFYRQISLNEVISYAGGFKDDANLNNINLNEIYYNNALIHISKLKKEDELNTNPIYDLNEITFKELINLENITEKRAANIILYREQNGRFKSVEELINVKNIGEKTFENISKHFKV